MARVYQGSVVESLGRLFATGTATAVGEAELLERFVSQGDPAAFEVILQRHGPMVLRVCRRVLDDPNDVDDAFQATFLILVKKAASIRDRDVLGTWLYGVARRVAVRARVNARRRQSRERSDVEAVAMEKPREHHAEALELRALLDDELERLPYRYPCPARPLRPRRPDARAGGGPASLPGRDGQEPAVTRPRAASGSTGPPGSRARGGPDIVPRRRDSLGGTQSSC